MGSSEIFLYMLIGTIGLVYYMLRPNKTKHPTPLEMKDFSPKRTYSEKQLPGAKPVQAEVITEDAPAKPVDEVDSGRNAKWASPVIFINGKPKDAYGLLGLPSGAPMAQVRSQVATLLEQKNTTTKVDIIKRAYQAIVDADNA